MELGLDGKAALVVAASQGIGFAVAQELAREGARLMITSRDEGNLRAAQDKLAASGVEVEIFAGDVTRAETCTAMVEACVKRYGGIDVLFTNAGGPPGGTFDEIEADQYQRAVELNLLSVVHLCRAAVPHMRSRNSGRIVALTSISVKQPVDGLILSNTARAGAQGFLKSLANEVGKDGITVNTVCPGYTATERLGELAAKVSARTGADRQQVFEGWEASIPVGRLGKPEEIAAAVVFLASERASYVNGVALAVDGGSTRSLL